MSNFTLEHLKLIISGIISKFPKPDWKQDDPLHPNYIKNRTHYDITRYETLECEISVGGYIDKKYYDLVDERVYNALLSNTSDVANILVDGLNLTYLDSSSYTVRYQIDNYRTVNVAPDYKNRIYVMDSSSPDGTYGTVKLEYTYSVEDAKKLDEKYLPENVAKVTKAKKGQQIIVKEVDKKGKPTDWECIDVKTPVQADYTQTDSSQLDYIKNKPTNLVKITDYATSSKSGLVRTTTSYGTQMSGQYIQTSPATQSDINSKTHNYRPIVPKQLDYAVKAGLTNNKLSWTNAEKENARNLIGAIGIDDIPEVVTTTDDKGKVVTVDSEGNKILEYPSMISYKYADKIQESNTGVLFCFDTAKPNLGLFSMPNKITTFRVYKDGVYIQGADLKTYNPFIELNVIDCNETRIFVIGKLASDKVISYFYYFSSNEWSVETQMLPLESLENMFIQRPDEAEVGQILVVKAVDENGKPIEWEVIDAPTGSGEDGYSPIATVEQTETGATISIQDKNGTTTAVVNHGDDGKDGKDGYTPQKGIDYFDGKDGSNGKDGADGKTAYQYAKDGGYTGTEEEFAQKLAKELPTKLSDLENDLELEVEGTVEITDGEPTKESTVLTVNPNAEEVNICTEEDFNAFKEEIDAKFDAFINAEEVSY